MSDEKMYAYIWEFTVNEEHIMKFEEAYGPTGKWAELFKKAEGYIKTELFHDTQDPVKYITIDYWKSGADRDRFMIQYSDEYSKLDSEFSAFTVNERYIGGFDVTC